MFIDEKGIDVPMNELSIASDEHRTPRMLELNPLGQLPILELDDGRGLSETTAICRYLEELHPEPALFGASLGYLHVGLGLVSLETCADVFTDVDISNVDRYDLEGRLRIDTAIQDGFGNAVRHSQHVHVRFRGTDRCYDPLADTRDDRGFGRSADQLL